MDAQINQIIERFATAVGDLETIDLRGTPYAATDAQNDIRLLVNAGVSLDDGQLLWWTELAVAIIDLNYHNPQSVERELNSLLNLTNDALILQDKNSPNPHVAAAIMRLTQTALDSYNKHPEFEEIMMSFKRIAVGQLDQNT